MRGSEKERVNNRRTVCPTKREISVRPPVESRVEMTSFWPSPLSPWVLSQETSQSITILSHDAVSKPLPSGVKTTFPHKTVMSTMLSHTFAHPHIQYRYWALRNMPPWCKISSIVTESNAPRKSTFSLLKTLENPSRSLRITMVRSEQSNGNTLAIRREIETEYSRFDAWMCF